MQQKIEKEIEKNFQSKEEHILDIGCGSNPGYHQKIEGKITCFDIQKEAGVQIVGTADALPFKKSTFSKVIMVNALYYTKNPQSVLHQIAEVLDKEGKVVLVTPFIYPVHDAPYDNYRFTEFGLKVMLEPNYKNIEIQCIGTIFSAPSVLLHSLLKGLPLLFPKKIRLVATVGIFIVFYPVYLLSQLLTLLGFLDRTRRWPTYYFTTASKK